MACSNKSCVSSYGKLVCILQDISSPDVFDFACNQPVHTVEALLTKLGCEELLLQDSDLVRVI